MSPLKLRSVRIAVLVLAIGLVLSPLSAADPASQVAPTPIARELSSSVVMLTTRESEAAPIIELGFFVKPNLIATSYKPIKNIKDLSSLSVRVVGNGKAALVAGNFMVDENADIALLRTTSPVGVPLSLNVNGIRLGEKVLVVTGADKAGVELIQTKTTGAGNIGGEHGCFIDMDKQPFKHTGGPVINGQGEVIGILVDRPEPDSHLISAVSVFAIVQRIGSQDKNQSARDGVSGELSGTTELAVPKTPCVEFLFGSSSRPPPPPPPPPGTTEELPKIIRKSGGVLQESALKRVTPEYPSDAKAARVSGIVLVEIVVDELGNVIRARSLSGHELLRDAATAAALQWKFRRTTLSGVPLKVIGTLTFNFNL